MNQPARATARHSAQPVASLYIDGTPVEGRGRRCPSITLYRRGDRHPARGQRRAGGAGDGGGGSRHSPHGRRCAWSNVAGAAARAAQIIRERAEELARLETLDTGKPIQETRVADWPSGADALEYFGGLAPR